MKPFRLFWSLFSLGLTIRVWAGSSHAQQSVDPYTEFVGQNTTSTPVSNIIKDTTNEASYPSYVGFIAAGIAVVFFGSLFVPIKKYETGDGVFFQWMLCAGIWLSGLVMQIIRQSTFYPYVMAGGVIWTTANMCVVPIFKTIGMGLGMSIWGMFGLLGGWASGRFGWFGIDAEVPKYQTLNYIGVSLAVASSAIYMLVKNSVTTPSVEMIVNVRDLSETQPLINYSDERKSINSAVSQQSTASDLNLLDKLSPLYQKIIGLTLSVVSGFMYGICFIPAIHVQDRVVGSSQNSLDYVFAHYCGIFLTSSVYFIIYAAIKRNKPKVYPEVILPAIVSGVMWGIATGCFFIANKALSEPVAFPIIGTVPGAIASLFWGVCIFKEIKGTRNIVILLLAVSVTTVGAVLAGVSK